MCANGVVTADLKPKPSALEIKQAQAPIIIEVLDKNKGEFIVKNRTHEIGFDELSLDYKIFAYGQIVEEGDIKLPANHEDSQELALNIDLSAVKDKTNEVYVNISVKTAVDYPWADRGHGIACTNLKHPAATLPKQSASGQNLDMSTRQPVGGKGRRLKVTFDCHSNCLQAERKGKNTF